MPTGSRSDAEQVASADPLAGPVDEPIDESVDGLSPEEAAAAVAELAPLVADTLTQDGAQLALFDGMPAPAPVCAQGTGQVGTAQTGVDVPGQAGGDVSGQVDAPMPGSAPQCVLLDVCEADVQKQIAKNDKDLQTATKDQADAKDYYNNVKKGYELNGAFSVKEVDQASLRLAQATARVEGLKALELALSSKLKLCANPNDADATCNIAIARERAAKADLTLAQETLRVANANLKRGLDALKAKVIGPQALVPLNDAVAQATQQVADATKRAKDATAQVNQICIPK